MSFKKLSLNSAIYFISQFLQRGFGLITLPLLTSYLSVSEYGNYVTLIAFSGLISVFFTLNIQSAIQRFYFDGKSALKGRKSLITSCVIFALFNSALVFLLFTISGPILIESYLNIEFYPLIFIVLLKEPFEAINTVYMYYLYTTEKGLKVSVYSILYATTNLALIYFLVVIQPYGLIGALLAITFTSILFSVYSWWHLRSELVLSLFKKSLVIDALKYALPLLPGFYIGYLVLSLDRVWLASETDSKSVAIYDVATKVASVVQILSVALSLAFKPWFFKNYAQLKDHSQDISVVIVAFYTLVALCLNTISDYAIEFLTNDEIYMQSVFYIPFLSFAWVLRGYDFFLSTIIQYSKETAKFLSLALALSGILGLSIMYILIVYYGIEGASIGKFVIFILIPLFYFFVIRVKKMAKIQFIRVLIIPLIALFFTTCFQYYGISAYYYMPLVLIYAWLIFSKSKKLFSIIRL